MNTAGSMGGSSPSSNTGSSQVVQPGEANTFGSLKSLFKQKYPTTKKCKHCGKKFIPKN